MDARLRARVERSEPARGRGTPAPIFGRYRRGAQKRSMLIGPRQPPSGRFAATSPHFVGEEMAVLLRHLGIDGLLEVGELLAAGRAELLQRGELLVGLGHVAGLDIELAQIFMRGL